MACSSCSGSFSTSCRCCLPSSGLSCDSSCPRNLVYTNNNCQLESSLNTLCEETCIEPINCQRSSVVSSSCQMPCYYLSSSTCYSPFQGTYIGSLGCGSSNFRSLGYESRSCFSGDCRPRGFIPVNYEVPVFPSLSNVFTLCYPTYLLYNTCQPSFCIPTCEPCLSGISC